LRVENAPSTANHIAVSGKASSVLKSIAKAQADVIPNTRTVKTAQMSANDSKKGGQGESHCQFSADNADLL